MNFGCIRVLNDDLVQPRRGFGTHPHRDAEIVTYVVRGHLTHQDSMGTKETLGRGSIQFMTAGTGIRHSEHNLADEPLRFIQTWLTPRERGLKPRYGSMVGDGTRRNKWAHLMSDVKDQVKTPVKVATDANLFVAELDAGGTLMVPVKSGRMGYLLLIEGSAALNEEKSPCAVQLAQHDAAELRPDEKNAPICLTAGENGAHVLVFDVVKGDGGRADL